MYLLLACYLYTLLCAADVRALAASCLADPATQLSRQGPGTIRKWHFALRGSEA